MIDTWTMKTGEVVPIARMADSHLTNTIYYLRKQAPRLVGLLDAVTLWADAPSHVWRDQEAAKVQDLLSVQQPAYDVLLEAAEARGLIIAPWAAGDPFFDEDLEDAREAWRNSYWLDILTEYEGLK